MALPEKLTLKQLLDQSQFQSEVAAEFLIPLLTDDGELVEDSPTLAQLFDWEKKTLRELDNKQWRTLESGQRHLLNIDRYQALTWARAYTALIVSIGLVYTISPEFRSSVENNQILAFLIACTLGVIDAFILLIGNHMHGGNMSRYLFSSNDLERIERSKQWLEEEFEINGYADASDYSFERAVKMIADKAEWNGPQKVIKNQPVKKLNSE